MSVERGRRRYRESRTRQEQPAEQAAATALGRGALLHRAQRGDSDAAAALQAAEDSSDDA